MRTAWRVRGLGVPCHKEKPKKAKYFHLRALLPEGEKTISEKEISNLIFSGGRSPMRRDVHLAVKEKKGKPPDCELWVESEDGTYYEKVPPFDWKAQRRREAEVDQFHPLNSLRRALG